MLTLDSAKCSVQSVDWAIRWVRKKKSTSLFGLFLDSVHISDRFLRLIEKVKSSNISYLTVRSAEDRQAIQRMWHLRPLSLRFLRSRRPWRRYDKICVSLLMTMSLFVRVVVDCIHTVINKYIWTKKYRSPVYHFLANLQWLLLQVFYAFILYCMNCIYILQPVLVLFLISCTV